MCLEIYYNQKSHIARKPITVFKHVKRNYNITGEYTTPYMRELVKFGVVIESKLFIDDDTENSIEVDLHSFASKKSCRIDAIDENSVAIVRCTIPAGAEYFVGTFYNDLKAYASNKIIYEEIIEKLSE